MSGLRLGRWIKHFAAVSVIVILTACSNDNNSDNVTTDPPSLQQPSSETVKDSNIPDAKVMLTEVTEMSTTLYFEPNNFELDSSTQLLIDPIAVSLRQHPDRHVIIVGHGDDFADEDDNIAISYERAFSVAIYIASVFGIDEERIQVVSAGSSEPMEGNGQNRRVDVISPKAIVRTLSPHNEPKF
ncbi:hypothetical protein ABT56_19490 [Photobacterium aquae]|uniref:OmpA-like domain-containing protein n=1 Tax=Photobacterium aquae TaxID=1195763 RepID=A0A0J1GUA5_9GAMM|nr:OmpA family protein [Photobacterium aquae]KLV03315.1 hypothetical protein ABT56_19490 [Photobacterium aquae]